MTGSTGKVFSDGENSIELGDNQQFHDLVVDIANRCFTTIFAAFRNDVD